MFSDFFGIGHFFARSLEIHFQEIISSITLIGKKCLKIRRLFPSAALFHSFFLGNEFPSYDWTQKNSRHLKCTQLLPISIHQYFNKTAVASPVSETVTTKRSPYSLSSIIGNCSLPTNAFTKVGVVLEWPTINKRSPFFSFFTC